MATLSRFSFSAFGLTSTEVSEKLDGLSDQLIVGEGGEPWVVTTDKLEKQCVNPKNVLDPKSWIYVGERVVLFAGPTPLDQEFFRDGFRPQA